MSKRKGGGGEFPNETARRWRNPNKIPRMAQGEINRLLDRDIDEILLQVTCARKNLPYPDKGGKKINFPDYVTAGFANLSTALWFYEYVRAHVKVKKGRYIKTDLTRDQVESLQAILADVYSKSLAGNFSAQEQELKERNAYISKAFIMLYPKVYQMTAKLTGLSKESRRDLTIQIYGDPIFKFKYIHRKMNDSTASDKVKLKFLKKAYGKRYVAALGAAMTTQGNGSDCLAMLFDDMMSVKKKKRGPYIRAYAEAYKWNGPSRYFRMDRTFYDKNKKLIKPLIGTKKHPEWAIDIGYRKAFKDMKKGKTLDTDRRRNNDDNRQKLGFRNKS